MGVGWRTGSRRLMALPAFDEMRVLCKVQTRVMRGDLRPRREQLLRGQGAGAEANRTRSRFRRCGPARRERRCSPAMSIPARRSCATTSRRRTVSRSWARRPAHRRRARMLGPRGNPETRNLWSAEGGRGKAHEGDAFTRGGHGHSYRQGGGKNGPRGSRANGPKKPSLSTSARSAGSGASCKTTTGAPTGTRL